MGEIEETKGAGGTPGGLGEFLLGLCMAVAGGWLLTNQVTVTSGFWTLWGHNAFGLSLLPLMVGIGRLFFDGRSAWGWLLTSLFNTLVMLVLLAGGLGLVARSLRAH